MKIDLLQFIVDLSRIATGEQHEEIKRVVLELQFSQLRFFPDDLGRLLFPAGARRIESIDYLHFGAFRERFVERPPLVRLGRAD